MLSSTADCPTEGERKYWGERIERMKAEIKAENEERRQMIESQRVPDNKMFCPRVYRCAQLPQNYGHVRGYGKSGAE